MINREVESIYVLFGAISTYSSIAKLTRLTFQFARYKIYTSFSKSCSKFPGNQHSSSSSFNRNTIENSNLLKNFPRILGKLVEISRKSRSPSSWFDRNTIQNSNLVKNFPLSLNSRKVIRNFQKIESRSGSIGIHYKILIFLKIFLFFKLSKSCLKFRGNLTRLLGSIEI